jgi:hypothetical protein
MKREYFRRIAMLETRKSAPLVRVPDVTAPALSSDVTEVLLGVLRSIEPYEACILEAERDGDLLRRSLKAAYANVGKERESYVELSAGS